MPKKPASLSPDEEELLQLARAFDVANARQLLADALRVGPIGNPPWPNRIMAAAARAFEWHGENTNITVKLRRGIDGLYGAGAPPEVNPLLLPFVLADVGRVRAGHDPSVVTRPQLRRYLADAVPPGRQGQRRSFLPERVANAKAAGWTDEMVMQHFGVKSPGAIRVLLSQAKKKKPRPTVTVSDIHPKLLTPAAAPTLTQPDAERPGESEAAHHENQSPERNRPKQAQGKRAARLPTGRRPERRRPQPQSPPSHDRPRRSPRRPPRKGNPHPRR